MDTPFSALERFNTAATPIRVRITLRSGALVDATALGGDEDGLLVAESATAEPKTVATADIIAVTIRERSHPRTMLMFIAMLVAGSALLKTVLRLPFVAPFLSETWLGGGIGFVIVAIFARVFKISIIERLLHPWRDIYRESTPTGESTAASHR